MHLKRINNGEGLRRVSTESITLRFLVIFVGIRYNACEIFDTYIGGNY